MRDLKADSIKIIKNIITNHTYSFHMFRRIFLKRIDDIPEMIDFWWENGEFKNMRLYRYLTELGYRKVGTVLKKVK